MVYMGGAGEVPLTAGDGYHSREAEVEEVRGSMMKSRSEINSLFHTLDYLFIPSQ